MAGFGQVRRHEYDRAARSEFFRSNFAGLTAFERHQRLLQQLGAYGAQGDAGSHDPAAMLAGTRSDADALRQVRLGGRDAGTAQVVAVLQGKAFRAATSQDASRRVVVHTVCYTADCCSTAV